METSFGTEVTLLAQQYLAAEQELRELNEIAIPYWSGVYQSQIGVHQVVLLELELQLAQVRAWIAAAQLKLNHGQNPDFTEIEEAWSEELLQQKLSLELAQVQARHDQALAAGLGPNWITPAELAALKSTYRRMAMALHPDLHAVLSEEQGRLWLLVQAAYLERDLPRLQALELLYPNLLDKEPDLTEATPALTKALRGLLDQIGNLRAQFPLSLEGKLSDPTWVLNTQSTLLAKIDDRRQALAYLQTHYDQLKAC